MKKSLIFLIAFGMALISLVPLLKASDASPPCYREIQTTFFRQDLVTTALSLYKVDQSFWIAIYSDLQANSGRVPFLVQTLAKNRNPNPLYPIFRPKEASEILQKALFDVLTQAIAPYSHMNNNSINNNTINGVFRYLWEQQHSRIQQCGM